ncbi:hypothetical protein [Nocardia sp. NBC_00511]|uniref:hypothetical protein n=1 Tax=Nocardia sp. NBC_00511 TaxID=2903591 RepID=UPI002F91458D
MPSDIETTGTKFTIVARGLHWIRAVAVITMLFIGMFMVGSIGEFHLLVTIVAAYLLYATFAAHLAAVLWHTLVIRNGMLSRMTFGKVRVWPHAPAQSDDYSPDQRIDEARADASAGKFG